MCSQASGKTRTVRHGRVDKASRCGFRYLACSGTSPSCWRDAGGFILIFISLLHCTLSRASSSASSCISLSTQSQSSNRPRSPPVRSRDRVVYALQVLAHVFEHAVAPVDLRKQDSGHVPKTKRTAATIEICTPMVAWPQRDTDEDFKTIRMSPSALHKQQKAREGSAVPTCSRKSFPGRFAARGRPFQVVLLHKMHQDKDFQLAEGLSR